MPVSPFNTYSGALSWRSAFWGAACAAAGYLPGSSIRDVLMAAPFHCTDVTWVSKSTPIDINAVFIDAGDTTYVGLEGTTSILQAVSYISDLGTILAGNPFQGWFQSFYNIANSILLDIKNNVPEEKPVVLCGHSIGGAAAFIAGIRLQEAGWNVRGVLTYGQPRCAHASGLSEHPLTANYCRIVNPGDVIPNWPKYTVPAGDVFFTLLNPVNIFNDVGAVSGHAGIEYSLAGQATPTDAPYAQRFFRDLGLKLDTIQISAHLMAAYTTGIWEKLNDAEKTLFAPIVANLALTDSINAQNIAIPGAKAETPVTPLVDVAAAETAFAATMIGGNAKTRVRLFKGPYTAPAPGVPITLTEADFAGYEPLPLPDDCPITGGGAVPVSIGPVVVTFQCGADTSPPQRIDGVHVTYEKEDGTVFIADAQPLASPILVGAAGQLIPVSLTIQLRQFGA